MNFRNAIKAIFGKIKKYPTSYWQEIGGYTSRFTMFGQDIYKNEVVRSCIRALAEHTSKANVKVVRNGQPSDKKLERLIQYRPNFYMNGKDFLAKTRTLLELYNTVFIYINRDDYGQCIGLYPIPECPSEAVDVSGRLYIKFNLLSGDVLTVSWEDLAVLRKDYNRSDIWGDDNTAILTSLDLLHTTNEGTANAIKSTANIRGILKSTKGMLSEEDRKRQRDNFVDDYMSITNASGVISLDAYQEYKSLDSKPMVANYKSIEELRNNIYRYFGVSEDVILGKVSGDDWEAFYEYKIEPFLVALGLELTNKIYTERQLSYNNEIIFESNRMQYMSTSDKLSLVQMVDRGALTPNEWRAVLNLAPIDGGDTPIRRLDTAPTNGGEDNADKEEQGIQDDEPASSDKGKTTGE